MAPNSPDEALGAQSAAIRDLLVEIVQALHTRMAEAHIMSGSRYAMGFGSQWRDLLDDARDALRDRGFRSVKLAPGGHPIPVVNDALVYVWRVPNSPDPVSKFASSPTRKSGFTTPPPDPSLWEPSLSDEPVVSHDGVKDGEISSVLLAAGDAMPLVLAMVDSTPNALQSIRWAVAALDSDGKVDLRGQETIWEPEPAAGGVAIGVESFDSGAPVEPKVEPREVEGYEPDA